MTFTALTADRMGNTAAPEQPGPCQLYYPNIHCCNFSQFEHLLACKTKDYLYLYIIAGFIFVDGAVLIYWVYFLERYKR